MKPEQFSKYAQEKYPISIDWTGQLPTSTTISSGTCSAIETESGKDCTSIVLDSPTMTIAGSESRLTVKGGQERNSYQITAKLVLSDTSILVDKIIMNVI